MDDADRLRSSIRTMVEAQSMTFRRIFAILAGKVRRLTAGLREKPDVQIEDYVLEHFLLYNGLIGSTPENQPAYKDVRNDIVQAVNDGSGHQLAIALRLPPLWWEDRLQKIFGDIAAINKDGAIACLMKERPTDDFTGDTTVLSHSDWRVRSNGARMLAFLDIKRAVPHLCDLLTASQKDQRAAFCHVAYSLAKLGSEQARQALSAELKNTEPWFVVDAAGALSSWNLASVSKELMEAILSGNELDDYMAVAIARKHSPSAFAEYSDEDIQEGTAELVLALLKALDGPFHSEAIFAEQLAAVAPRINELVTLKPTPRRLLAAIKLNRWLTEQSDKVQSVAAKTQIKDLSAAAHYEAVKQTLCNPSLSTPAELGQFRHALALAKQFKTTELSPYLVPLLKEDSPALVELIECLAELGDLDAAPLIARIIESKINLAGRCSQSFSAQPVFEEDKPSADLYWSSLKALGLLSHKSSLDILTKAVNDFAPDKREQALISLQTVLLSEDLRLNHYTGNLQELIQLRLDDPSLQVQAAALSGVAQHRYVALIPEVINLAQSREAVVHRQATETLISLANNGHKDEVKSALEKSMSKEYESARKQRIMKLLERI